MPTFSGSGTTIDELPVMSVAGTWDEILHGSAKATFERGLPVILRDKRWFGGKGRLIKSATITENVPFPHSQLNSYIALVRIEYGEGQPDTYLLGLSFVAGEKAGQLLERDPAGAFVRLRTNEGDGVLFDAFRERDIDLALLDCMANRRKLKGSAGEIVSLRTGSFRKLRGPESTPLEPSLMKAEQSNTSVLFGDRLILKLFRRVDCGTNPDYEIGRFLTERGFTHCPPVAGALELRARDSDPRTLAILQGFVRNQGDAWKYTLQSLHESFEKALHNRRALLSVSIPSRHLLVLAQQEAPPELRQLFGPYPHSARLLGRRTAEMHLALASSQDDPDFAPEPFSQQYQGSVFRTMSNLAEDVLHLLETQLNILPSGERKSSELLLSRRQEILDELRVLLDLEIQAGRIRVHGDYHLGQVLFTGRDFVIIDFEGEPLRTISDRRIKRSPLRDVAGMLRSFHYAGYTALAERQSGGTSQQDTAVLEHFVRCWCPWVSSMFLGEYLHTCADATFVPRDRHQLQAMLNAFQLDKAIYELGYEINNRPGWVHLPISGITQLLDQRLEERRIA